MGALNIQQRSSKISPATNFTAFRLRRNVLGNSDVGLIFLNKDSGGSSYNRVIGGDANFRLFQNLDVNAAAARTFSPATYMPQRGSESLARAGFN